MIDPVLAFNVEKKQCSIEAILPVIDYIEQQAIELKWILETHIHADHLTSASLLQQRCSGLIAISEDVCQAQQLFQPLYPEEQFYGDGRQFDVLLNADSKITLGEACLRVIPSAGHTPTCVCFYSGQHLFVGDTL